MGTAEDTAHEKANWHWRNTMRPVRFFAMDARVAIIYFAMIGFWAHLWAWILMVVNTMIFMYLEKKGLTFPSALRKFRTWIHGKLRPAWPRFKRRRLVDYG